MKEVLICLGVAMVAATLLGILSCMRVSGRCSEEERRKERENGK